MPRCFKPTQEQMDAYSHDSYDFNIKFSKLAETEILILCMSDNNKVHTVTLFNDLCDKLKLYEASVRLEAKDSVYSWYKNDNDGVLRIYGRRNYYEKDEIADIFYNTVEDLCLFGKAVIIDNYFDNNSNFFRFKSEILNKLEFLKDVIFDDEICSIMNELKDCEIDEQNHDLREFHNEIVSTCEIFTNQQVGYMPIHYCMDKNIDTDNSIREEYNNIVKKYTEAFANKYFKDVPTDTYWIGMDGVLFINDFYFNFDTIKYAIDNNVSELDLFDWYEHLTEYGLGTVNVNIPTLSKWYENRENNTKRLEWELLVHYKRLFDFTDKDFIIPIRDPEENGYYLVVFTTGDGIYQRAIEWSNGSWKKYPYEILHMIARTKTPIKLQHMKV